MDRKTELLFDGKRHPARLPCYTSGISAGNREAYERAIDKVLKQLAGAGAERSTTDRPSDAPPAVSHGGRAHPTAPASYHTQP